MDERRRTIAWRGVDDPQRHDVAWFVLRPDRLGAAGRSVTAEYELGWGLATTAGWVTSALRVEVRGDGWHRSLLLSREDDGEWTATGTADGREDLPPPGTGADLAGALDCDLGLCPATNTMPVLRLGLTGDRPAPPTDLVMALVEVPSLRVVRSEQTYGRIRREPGGGALVSFAAGSFRTTLPVDADGLVVRYPGLADHLS